MENAFVVWDWDIEAQCPEGYGMDYQDCLNEFWMPRFKDGETPDDEKIKTMSAYHFEIIPLTLADFKTQEQSRRNK